MANVIRIARRIVIGQNRTVWRGLSISGHKMNEVVTNEKDKQLDLYDNKEKDISEVTGVPMDEMATRTVRIYKPARNAMQSGTYATRSWILDFDTQERWENPLMGWASSADPVSNLHVQFNSKEEAIAFAEKNGWTYTVDKPQEPTMIPKSYGVNFSWNKKTRISTK